MPISHSFFDSTDDEELEVVGLASVGLFLNEDDAVRSAKPMLDPLCLSVDVGFFAEFARGGDAGSVDPEALETVGKEETRRSLTLGGVVARVFGSFASRDVGRSAFLMLVMFGLCKELSCAASRCCNNGSLFTETGTGRGQISFSSILIPLDTPPGSDGSVVTEDSTSEMADPRLMLDTRFWDLVGSGGGCGIEAGR